MTKRTSKSAKIKYTDEPLGKTQVVPDFLPSPVEPVFREEGVKVTAYVDAQAPTLRSRGRSDKRRAP